jgi:formate hydrogenlyase transcriptional activator
MAEDSPRFEGEARPHEKDFETRPDLPGHRVRPPMTATELMSRARSTPELLHELGPHILSLTGCEFLKLSLHDPIQNCMITHYWKKGQEAGQCDAFAVDDCVSGWVWQRQEAIVIPDVEKEKRFPLCMQQLHKYSIRSYCMFPLTVAARRFGAFGLGKSVAEVLDQRSLEFFRGLAFMMAMALDNQEVQRAWETERDRLQGLVAIAQELSSSLEPEKLIRNVLGMVRRILGLEHAVLMLVDEDGKGLRKYAMDSAMAAHFKPQEVNHVPLHQSLSKRAIESRTVTYWNGQDLIQTDAPVAEALRSNGLQAVINVPLLAHDGALGSLNLASIHRHAFNASDTAYLQQVATLLTGSILNAKAYREVAQLKDRLTGEKRYLEGEIRGQTGDEIVGNSPSLKRVLDYASIVASTNSTVLITGETGTGKELVAHAVHTMSPRKDRSFIKVNCAAIPTGLLESELFGHEKGAFTGAVSQKIGRLELADKGTLFLDEIGEIPLELQPKLLRVLQDQEFERLGGTRTLRVDARLLAATNRDLARAVEEKQFRSDLFYRLHVFPLHLPPLRDRREDIPALVQHFVDKSSLRLGRRIESIPKEAMDAMLRWHWPGNIRELENFIERSVILSEGSVLCAPLAELRLEMARQNATSDGTLEDRERQHIIEVLRQTRGVLAGARGAAARLGLKRTTLQYKLQKLGISRTGSTESLD